MGVISNCARAQVVPYAEYNSSPISNRPIPRITNQLNHSTSDRQICSLPRSFWYLTRIDLAPVEKRWECSTTRVCTALFRVAPSRVGKVDLDGRAASACCCEGRGCWVYRIVGVCDVVKCCFWVWNLEKGAWNGLWTQDVWWNTPVYCFEGIDRIYIDLEIRVSCFTSTITQHRFVCPRVFASQAI